MKRDCPFCEIPNQRNGKRFLKGDLEQQKQTVAHTEVHRFCCRRCVVEYFVLRYVFVNRELKKVEQTTDNQHHWNTAADTLNPLSRVGAFVGEFTKRISKGDPMPLAEYLRKLERLQEITHG